MKKIALIGLGTMGPGMVARLARGGIDVAAYDIAAPALEKAAALIETARGVLDSLEISSPAGKEGEITLTNDLSEAVSEADLVIENVPENIEIKASVYREIDALVGSEVIVASDTSGIPITSLQQHISNPGRMVGMHWSNPPHIIPMIEVISGEHTTPDTAQAIKELIRSIDLLPVVVKKDVPGFVENRVLYALLREVIDLVEQGVVDPEDIDTCVSWGIGYKLAVIGPMALLDMAGMDIYNSVSGFLNAELADRKDVPTLVKEKIAAGELGLKSGAGIYDYTPDKIAELQKQRAQKLVAIRRILEDRAMNEADNKDTEELNPASLPASTIEKKGNVVTRSLHTGLGIVLLIVVAINVMNAGSRYLFGVSPVGADELMIYLIIWLVMIASILSYFSRTHISVNILPLYTNGRVRHLWYVLQDVAALFASAFATYASWLFVGRIARIGVTSMGLGMPMTIPHAALLCGFAGLTIAAGIKLVLDLVGLARNSPLPEVQI